MKVDEANLTAKIKQMYPEIDKYGVAISASLDAKTNAWLVKMTKGENVLTTHVEVRDAEKCLADVECVYLGTQIGQFIRAYCLKGDACPR